MKEVLISQDDEPINTSTAKDNAEVASSHHPLKCAISSSLSSNLFITLSVFQETIAVAPSSILIYQNHSIITLKSHCITLVSKFYHFLSTISNGKGIGKDNSRSISCTTQNKTIDNISTVISKQGQTKIWKIQQTEHQQHNSRMCGFLVIIR